jgi:hypothetical protein
MRKSLAEHERGIVRLWDGWGELAFQDELLSG